jgi:glyoxylase-like metal-dependent hydrolase (beta-lactamase superfamily II)
MRLSHRCFAVTGLGYWPPWSVNAGFVAGERITLVVDTGATAMAGATVHGYASAARPGNQLVVVNTERHFDHIGGNGFFRERGADVYGHPGVNRTAGEFRAEIDELNAGIPNPVRRARREAEVFFHGTKLTNPNRAIDRDFTMDLGDCDAQILLTPGHTPTNVCVFVSAEGVLFSGDTLVNGYLPNLECGGASQWREWLASLDRIAALAPRIIVPGHGPVAAGDDAAGLVARVRSTLEEAIASGAAPTSRAL